MGKRSVNLGNLVKELGREGVKKLFADRIANGESLQEICEDLKLPYNDAALVIGLR